MASDGPENTATHIFTHMYSRTYICANIAGLPSEADFKSIKAKLASDGPGKTADGWQKAVQGRLEEIEEVRTHIIYIYDI